MRGSAAAKQASTATTPHIDQQVYAAPTPIGVNLPLDPILAAAGAFWNEQRELVVRRTFVPAGEPVVRNGRKVQPVVPKVERVAPPGMSIEEARALGLHFYSPALGWVWWGSKRAQEYPENMGIGTTQIEYLEVETDDSSGE